jgi:5-methylthioadenosine/S-adenosylhomocysteine deaminase
MSNQTKTHADFIIDAQWIIPIEPKTILHKHSLIADHGRIIDILPTEQAHAKFNCSKHYSLTDHALIPGLINLHTHAAMNLLRGVADDLPLMDWLKNHIWPLEGKHVSDQFVYDGTLLACAEMLMGGITCFNDMYFFPGAAARAAIDSKMRAMIGLTVIDFPTRYASDPEDYLTKGFAARDEFKHEPLIKFCLAPHAPYTVGDKTFEKILTYTEELNIPIHIHLQETEDEIKQSLETFKVRPVERLHKLGLLGPNMIAVHSVHMTADEIKLLANQNVHIAHCPTSNLKLASGIAPISQMLEHNINIGIGTDGAASNNRLDMFEEMRLAALLAKARANRADTLPAWQALQMATLNSARAMGMDAEVGSLVPGKAADIVAVNLSNLETAPCYDPVSHLVYVAGREHVSHVWINGNLAIEDRKLNHLNLQDLQNNAQLWKNKLVN